MDMETDVKNCLETLRRGGLILYPTDTIWGIGCDASNPEAIQKIYDLKQRPGSKSMIVLVAESKDILTYVSAPDPKIFDFLETTQKPTTVIYEGAIGLASNLIADDGTVAIRIVHEIFCRHLIKRLRKPLVSTSANISGSDSPRLFNEIPESIKKGVDYIVQYRQDDLTEHAASAIVKMKPDGTVTYIRT